MERTIIHCDMDAFFAAVEQHDNPDLAQRPLLVGGHSERGVVCACSYQARPFGVRSGMAMRKALSLCPDAVVRPVRMTRYQQVSQQIFAILAEFSDLVEPLSIDEAFLDVSGCRRLLGSGAEIAAQIRQRIRRATGLAVSAGVAPNKFLAKLASDEAKPDGLLLVEAERVDDFLLPLGVEKIWGVGRVMEQRLKELGIRKVRELRSWPRKDLERRFGSAGGRLYDLARGIDPRPVVPGRQVKSIGAEETFCNDLADQGELRRRLLDQAEQATARLRRQGMAALGMTLKIRFDDFTTITRSATFERPEEDAAPVWERAVRLLELCGKDRRPVRLSGIYLTGLVTAGAGQQELFPDPDGERRRRLTRALDDLRERFGSGTARRASLLDLQGSVQRGKQGQDGGE